MKHLKSIILLCACFMTAQTFAQEATLPTHDAKALAMGGVVTTTESSAHALYNNAANAAFSRTPFKLSSSYYRQGDYNSYSVTGGYRLTSRSVIQAGWRQYLREDHNSDMAVDLGFSHAISERLAIGVVGRYMHQRRPRYMEDGSLSNRPIIDNALAVDLSVAYYIPIENLGSYSTLRTGAKLCNLGAYLAETDYTLPMNMLVGAALDTYITDEHEITIAADLGYYFYPKPVRGFLMSVGAEYNFMQLLQFRGGYHYGESDSYYPSYGSVGVGIRFLHLRLDFAYLFAKKDTPFRNTYSLSFGLDF